MNIGRSELISETIKHATILVSTAHLMSDILLTEKLYKGNDDGVLKG